MVNNYCFMYATLDTPPDFQVNYEFSGSKVSTFVYSFIYETLSFTSSFSLITEYLCRLSAPTLKPKTQDLVKPTFSIHIISGLQYISCSRYKPMEILIASYRITVSSYLSGHFVLHSSMYLVIS